MATLVDQHCPGLQSRVDHVLSFLKGQVGRRGALVVSLGVLLVQKTSLQIATRVLPFDQVVILMLGGLIWHSNLPIVSYLRAHGGDPWLPGNLISTVLLFAVNLTLGRWFGP